MAKAPSSSLEVYLTPELVGKVCEESCERMQLVADILLLRGESTTGSSRLSVLEPVSGVTESYSKLCDTIIASTKVLAISIQEFGQQVDLLCLSNIKQLTEKITKQAIEITEVASSAAYQSALIDVHCKPAKQGVIDHYRFERAKQELHMSYNKFKPVCPLSAEHVLSISKNIAENLAILTRSCALISENNKVSPIDRAQFATCCQSLQGTTAAFLTTLKAFASSRTEDNRKRCLLFGKPLLSAVDSIIEFSSYPQFSGKPAILTTEGYKSQIDILGGAMAIISSCIQLLDTAKSILSGYTHDKKNAWQKLASCIKAVFYLLPSENTLLCPQEDLPQTLHDC